MEKKRIWNKTKTFAVLCVVALIALCVSSFVACDKTGGQDQFGKIAVNFDAQDGSKVESKLVSPTAIDYIPPAREGYDFVGWTMDKQGNEPLDASKIKLGTTLYGQWKQKTFSVNFYVNDELVKSDTVAYGNSAIAPTEQEIKQYLGEGEIFGGWDQRFDNVKGNLYVYAQVGVASCTVKFVVDGEEKATHTGSYGNVIPTVDSPEKDGFVFDKWVDENGNALESGATFKTNTTYVAVWALAIPTAPSVESSVSITYGENATINGTHAGVDGIVYTYEWRLNGEKVADGKTLSVTAPNAGSYEYEVFTVASLKGYESKTSQANKTTLTVEKAELVATIDDISLVYGSTLGKLDIKYAGFVNGDDKSVVDESKMTVNTDYTQTSPVGDYLVSVSGLAASNYTIVGSAAKANAISATITVNQKAFSLSDIVEKATFNGKTLTKTYDESIATGLLNGHKLSFKLTTDNSDAATYTGETLKAEYTLTDADGNDVKGNYFAPTYKASFVIEEAQITYQLPQTLTFDYDGHAKEAAVRVATGFEVQYSLDGKTWDVRFPAISNAGTHKVSFKIVKKNYKSVESSFDVVINKAAITIVASNQTAVYGQDFTLDQKAYTTSGDTYGNTFDVTLDCGYTLGNPVGNYDITASVKDNANFDITVEPGKLSVSAATLTVSVADQNVTYGENFVPTLDIVTAKGLAAGDTIDTILTISTNYTQGDNHDDYEIVCTLKSTNYTLASDAKATLHVAKRNVTVTIDNASVVYGEIFDLANCTYKVTSGSLYGKDAITLAYNCGYTQGDNAGTQKDITATATASENYVVAVEKGTLSVTKRLVSVKVDDARVVYGENAPSFAYTVTSGSFYGTAPTAKYACDYQKGATKAEYVISATFEDDNHQVSVENGTLYLDKRNAKVSYSKTVAYQDNKKATIDLAFADPDGEYAGDKLSGELTTKGFALGEYVRNGEKDDFDAANVKMTNAAGEDVTSLYTISYDVKVLITEQYIDHTANPVKAIYDGTAKSVTVTAASDVAITYSTDGATYSDVNPSFVGAGTYEVFYRLEQSGKTTTDGKTTITISKREATITATDQTAIFGEPFTLAQLFTHSNLVNESDAVVSLTCTYKTGDNASTYTIEATVDDNANYNFTAVNGTLTVGKKNVTVTASGFATTYGEDADLTAFSVNVESAKQYVTLVSDYQKGSDAGEYAVRAISSSDNYSVTIEGVVLAVAKRKVTIKANDLTTVYGTAPKFDFTATNLYSADVVSGVTFACDGKDASDTGYTIVPSVADTKNYTFETQNGVLVIKKARLTVNFANIPQITYGDNMPEPAVASYDGFMYEDNQSVVSGTLKADCAYNTNPAAGTFDITFSGLLASNYDIAYGKANLVVKKATLTLTANDIAPITYGDDVPSVSFVASGFKFDDQQKQDEILSGIAVTIDTQYTKGSNASQNGYAFNLAIDKTETANYNLAIGAGKKFVVNKAKYTGITHPTIEGGVYAHEKLSAYTLQANFYWDDETAYPTCDVTQYLAHYNADTVNYENFDLYVTLLLEKATVTITETVNDDANNYTGNPINLAACVSATSNNLDNNAVTIPALSGTDGGYYTITLTTPETVNFKAASKQVSVRIKAAKIGEKWYTVEDALNVGGAITLAGNAFISKNVTVKANTTFTLPSGDGTADSATTIGNAEPAYGAGQSNFVDTNASFVNLTLTINNGTTVDVNGNVLILGLLGRAGAGLSGHTSGKHSQIINNGTINVKSGGKLDVRGYIKGSGVMDAESGANVYSPFVVHDFRGGTNTVTVFKKAKISPFVQYEMPNIQCEQFFRTGATHTGYFDLYAGSQHNYCSKPIIAAKGMIQLTSGYVRKTYNNQRTSLTIAGNANLGSLSLTITMKIDVTVNMSDVTFAIPWMYDIHIGDGTTATTLTAPYDYKILPGASITVEKNATLTTSKSIIVYSSFTDTSFGGSVYPEKPAATFVVNGTYNINGSFGGNIQSTQAGAKVVVGSKAKLSVNEVEGNSGGTTSTQAGALAVFGLGGEFIKVFDITETARFGAGTCNETITPKTYKDTSGNTVNYNEVVRSYSGGTALAKGKTYTYNGTAWA